ncbi:MAG: rhodanese-like domain-containing protein [Desulfotomaculum sp.]|nr:rhodanese-like domain-containing protein [Desulfotomaculum sp.]
MMLVGCPNEEKIEAGYRDITAGELKEMLDSSSDILMIDVREPYEYNAGHIAGSILRPLGKIESWSKELDKDKPIVLICRSGNRSAQAARCLVDQGFTNVMNLKGGVKAWPYGLVENVDIPGAA